jgi:methionyl aminopeptidase
MIKLKKESEIEKMKKGGNILALVLNECLANVKPGVSEKRIDELADKLIAKYGAKPAFKMVDGYEHATCISTNNVVVHGIPSDYRFKKGDLVGIDCGVYYDGLNTDMSETILVSTQNSKLKTQNYEKLKFLETGKKALEEAIKQAEIGNRIGQISKTIQEIVEAEGYAIVRSLVGHGVGIELHEDPEVPGFLDKKIEKTPKLVDGMTIAIEVIYNMGQADVVYSKDDGWTIATKDGSVSGLFERTIAITRNGPIILTS